MGVSRRPQVSNSWGAPSLVGPLLSRWPYPRFKQCGSISSSCHQRCLGQGPRRPFAARVVLSDRIVSGTRCRAVQETPQNSPATLDHGAGPQRPLYLPTPVGQISPTQATATCFQVPPTYQTRLSSEMNHRLFGDGPYRSHRSHQAVRASWECVALVITSQS